MEKKNLEYVYCKTTEENYKKLVEVVFEKSTFLVGWEAFGTKWGYIAISDQCRIMCGVTKEYIEEHPEYKEIHLVDGEFEFVADEQKQECQFAKYGFEVPKDIEEDEIVLLGKDSKNTILGTVAGLAFCWREGKAYRLRNDFKRVSGFDLTPIKKPWYEDENNFPCLVKWIDVDNKTVFDVVKSYSDGKLKGNVDEYFFPSMIELPTKEEVLSLFKEEK